MTRPTKQKTSMAEAMAKAAEPGTLYWGKDGKLYRSLNGRTEEVVGLVY